MPDDDSDKRRAPRKEVFGHAVILGLGLRANCIIRDLSATGAKLGVSHRVKLPPKFYVQLVKLNSTRLVNLRWRHGDFIGVQFCKNETVADPAAANRTADRDSIAGVKSSWRVRE
jgi:hypothetical protein